MNHDPPSSAQRAPAEGVAASHVTNTPPPGTPVAKQNPRDKLAKNRKLFNKKREAFLTDLLRNMDILTYAELSAIYYMDCSFLRFLLRALLQLTFLSPKPEGVPPPPIQSGNRPVIFVILANITCIIIHAVSTPLSGGEATRGYLHGGVAMDFIGQKGPSSRIHLILLDLLVLLLQILCFGVSTTRIKAKKSAEEPESSGTSGRPNAAPRQEQTLDFEERGQLASEHRPEDIELRDLNPPGRAAGLEDREEAETTGLLSIDRNNDEGRLRALDSRPDRSDQDLYILDAFFSGEAVVGSLSPPRIIREQLALAVLAEQAAANSSQTSSGDPEMVPRSGMFGVRMQVGDRIFRI